MAGTDVPQLWSFRLRQKRNGRWCAEKAQNGRWVEWAAEDTQEALRAELDRMANTRLRRGRVRFEIVDVIGGTPRDRTD